jgi:hypothetical protein
VFSRIEEKDVISWTVLIHGNALEGNLAEFHGLV